MNDLISRQAAIDALRDYLIEKRCPDDGTLTCRLIENEVINKLPSAQPEIVRCGECKWWNFAPDNTMLPDWHGCRYYGARMHTRVEDFCSRGERRE